jgi:hypothetical protein
MTNMNAMETYKQSAIFMKSNEGFDRRAYSGWKECFETWVIPLAVDMSHLEEELNKLKGMVNEHEGRCL